MIGSKSYREPINIDGTEYTLVLHPDDLKVTGAFATIANIMMETGAKLKEIGVTTAEHEKEREAFKDDLNTADEFEKFLAHSRKDVEGISVTREKFDALRPYIDTFLEVDGEESAEAVLFGGRSKLNLLMDIMDFAADKFDEAGEAWKQYRAEKKAVFAANRAARRQK